MNQPSMLYELMREPVAQCLNSKIQIREIVEVSSKATGSMPLWAHWKRQKSQQFIDFLKNNFAEDRIRRLRCHRSDAAKTYGCAVVRQIISTEF